VPRASGVVSEEKATPSSHDPRPPAHDIRAVTPKSGVEILTEAETDGERTYTMRDLGSGRVLENVTRKTARRLWRQALLDRENGLPADDAIQWRGDLGLWGSAIRDGVRRLNLAYRAGDGTIGYFFAVSEDGLTEPWRDLI